MRSSGVLNNPAAGPYTPSQRRANMRQVGRCTIFEQKYHPTNTGVRSMENPFAQSK
jgi:hypothetical protein